jgi:hypothetical protein
MSSGCHGGRRGEVEGCGVGRRGLDECDFLCTMEWMGVWRGWGERLGTTPPAWQLMGSRLGVGEAETELQLPRCFRPVPLMLWSCTPALLKNSSCLNHAKLKFTSRSVLDVERYMYMRCT